MMTEAKNFRAEMRDNAAYVALETAKMLGVQVVFQDRATMPRIKLWAIPGPERSEIVLEDTMQEQVTQKYFDVPRQYGCSCGHCDCPRMGTYTGHDQIVIFPPENGVSVQAQIFSDDHEWSVKTPDVDSLHAMYKLHCERHQARRTRA